MRRKTTSHGERAHVTIDGYGLVRCCLLKFDEFCWLHIQKRRNAFVHIVPTCFDMFRLCCVKSGPFCADAS